MTTTSRPTRTLVVDDEALVRTGLRMILEAAGNIEVVAEAVRMPGIDGVGALTEINRLPDPPAVIMLTTFDRDEYVHGALRARAAGFLLKDTAPRDLIAAVRAVAEGNAILAPTVTRRLIDAYAGQRSADFVAARQRLSVLTDRERRVVAAVARGLANAEVARELGMAETTVKVHVSRSLTKLGLSNRVQIALLVRDAGSPGG